MPPGARTQFLMAWDALKDDWPWNEISPTGTAQQSWNGSTNDAARRKLETLVQAMLHKKPSERPTAAAALQQAEAIQSDLAET